MNADDEKEDSKCLKTQFVSCISISISFGSGRLSKKISNEKEAEEK